MGPFKLISVFATLAFWLTPAWSDKTLSVEVCETKYGASSVNPLGTTTLRTTIHQTVGCVGTVTPTYTVQPTPKTVTAATTVYVTKTTTLPNTKISTLTSTNTVQSTVSVTNTITSTVSTTAAAVTITAPQSTNTISTSPGFIPANSVLNSGPPVQDPEEKRQLRDHKPDIEKRVISTASGYPATVTCGLLVDIIATNSKIVTATKTSTVTAKTSTVTKIATTTSTLTSTVCPAGASTTVTVTTTLAPVTSSFTTSTTTTSTVAITVTAQQPDATFYAACAADNLVSEIYDSAIDSGQNGNITLAMVDYYSKVGNSYLPDQTISIANNAYDCCVQCITDDNCGGGYFATDGTNQCVISHPTDDCDPSNIGVNVFTGEGGDPNTPLTAFDGNCGHVLQQMSWQG
ncbi:MAG: hypothetical protein Q9195_005763 [Heterodermia aff. obscurata]